MEKQRIIVITDMEPDDMGALIALQYYADKSGKYEIEIIIEHQRLKEWQGHFPSKSCSRKCFSLQAGSEPGSFGLFDNDVTPMSLCGGEDWRSDVVDQGNIIICLADFRYLVEFAQKCPDVARTCTVWAYGSANIRWALEAGVTKEDMLKTINHSYKEFNLFENYPAYGPGLISNNTAPNLLEYLSGDHSELQKDLKREIERWNELCKRRGKFMDQAPLHFNFADIGCIIGMFEDQYKDNWEPKEILLDEKYVTIRPYYGTGYKARYFLGSGTDFRVMTDKFLEILKHYEEGEVKELQRRDEEQRKSQIVTVGELEKRLESVQQELQQIRARFNGIDWSSLKFRYSDDPGDAYIRGH